MEQKVLDIYCFIISMKDIMWETHHIQMEKRKKKRKKKQCYNPERVNEAFNWTAMTRNLHI